MSKAGSPFTIFIVSKLTLMTRSNNSKGYFGSFMVSVAQRLASLVMPLSLSVMTD
jgi:hypothetical protein